MSIPFIGPPKSGGSSCWPEIVDRSGPCWHNPALSGHPPQQQLMQAAASNFFEGFGNVLVFAFSEPCSYGSTCSSSATLLCAVRTSPEFGEKNETFECGEPDDGRRVDPVRHPVLHAQPDLPDLRHRGRAAVPVGRGVRRPSSSNEPGLRLPHRGAGLPARARRGPRLRLGAPRPRVDQHRSPGARSERTRCATASSRGGLPQNPRRAARGAVA